MKLEEVIQQKKFSSEAAKAAINIMLTSSWLTTSMSRVLRPFGMTWQQFNIMRILRGQKGVPASLKLVSERMIDQMSNTSRLIDKLVLKGLVERRSCPEDRRRVELSLTKKGQDVLREATAAMDDHIDHTLGTVGNRDLNRLNKDLDEIRNTIHHIS